MTTQQKIMTQQTTCQHQHDIELLVQLSLSRRHASTASVVVSKRLADEKMAACKAECGDASPYRDVELHPISRKDAVALVKRSHYGYLDAVVDEFADIGRALRAGIRRILRRSAATDTEVTHPR
ncbi:hypothetical protein [Amycolatopsis minnesotensis]|uniref:Uncharacterized protein n=1 Tax=Amycolatopsis minnesotensis TaxID=337894 RepID=A0ABP5DNG0_9PSEU